MGAKETLKKRLKEERAKNNMTLKELAECINVKEATVQRYESGEIKAVPYEKVVLIAETFGVTPAYLMGWDYEFKDTPKQSDASIRQLEAYKKAFAHNEAIAEIPSNLETLNAEGINKVLEYTNILAGNPEYVQKPKAEESKESDVKEPELYAAHERTDIEVTDEMRQHDDDIMNDENF